MFYSPYSGTDANCGNPLIISIDELIAEGLLDAHDAPPRMPVGDVDFPAVTAAKAPALKYAAARLLGDVKFNELRLQMTLFRSVEAVAHAPQPDDPGCWGALGSSQCMCQCQGAPTEPFPSVPSSLPFSVHHRKANPWIEDSAIFEVARNLPDLCTMAWWDWPEPLRFR